MGETTSLTNKERKELGRLRQRLRTKRTLADYRRLIELKRKTGPRHELPKQEKR